MPSIVEWIFNPIWRGSPTGLIVDRSVVQPTNAFVEYTGVPALFGGSVVPVASQAVYQGGQAKFITQPAVKASTGKTLSFRSAFAAEFFIGTMVTALALTIIDPKDHREGGLAETTWWRNNITNFEWKSDLGIGYAGYGF